MYKSMGQIDYMKLTCICPCWGRPARTLRAMESVANQYFEGAETIFIGDGCAEFQKLMDEGAFDKYIQLAKEKGNDIIVKNLDEHYGGWGSTARKIGIDMARGEYVCFLDNDDVLKPNHFSSYYTNMAGHKDAIVGHFNAFTQPLGDNRHSTLNEGGVGMCELVFKTHQLKHLYKIDNHYHHDWRLVERFIKANYKVQKFNVPRTYIIMSVPNFRETGID